MYKEPSQIFTTTTKYKHDSASRNQIITNDVNPPKNSRKKISDYQPINKKLNLKTRRKKKEKIRTKKKQENIVLKRFSILFIYF